MGSETGAKWMIMLVLYFTLMTVVVSLIISIASSSIAPTGGYDITTNSTGVYCSLPRTTYEPWVENGEQTIRATSSDDIHNPNPRNNADWLGTLECKYSRGQLGQDQCESISGCEWEQYQLFWFIGVGDYTCRGEYNHSWINESDTQIFLGDLYISYDDGLENDIFVDRPDYGICEYEPVKNNQTRCLDMGCTWGKVTKDIDLFSSTDVGLNGNMLSTMWDVIKDMVSFRFDFGFDNTTVNFILNFLIFWLPLIGLGLSIYVMVRS